MYLHRLGVGTGDAQIPCERWHLPCPLPFPLLEASATGSPSHWGIPFLPDYVSFPREPPTTHTHGARPIARSPHPPETSGLPACADPRQGCPPRVCASSVGLRTPAFGAQTSALVLSLQSFWTPLSAFHSSASHLPSCPRTPLTVERWPSFSPSLSVFEIWLEGDLLHTGYCVWGTRSPPSMGASLVL